MNVLTITNATKAQIIVVINAVLALLVAFNVALTQTQLSAISAGANAVLGLWVSLTFTQSSKRTPGA